jgi:hypothetical protein
VAVFMKGSVSSQLVMDCDIIVPRVTTTCSTHNQHSARSLNDITRALNGSLEFFKTPFLPP